MNEIEWKLYQNWFHWLSDKFSAKPDSIVYLRCDPMIAYNRVKKRARSEEDTISLDYLTRLSYYHDQWLLNEKSIPVKIINVDEDFIDNEEKIQTMYQEIFQ